MTISGADDVMWRLLVWGRVFVVAFLTWTAAADTWFQTVTTSDLRLFEPAPGILRIKYIHTIIVAEIV